jgi:crotonobetainyl-CoA:carnitine CoA-transferase CaiB-like acyl-CoA transferase
MLSPYRVLDLTDQRAALGPMMLADLGAEVVRVESGPLPDPDDPRWAAYNRGKRSVALDLDSEPGQEAFRRLVATADFVFENAPPGVMAARGLAFDDLRRLNPRVVHVAITPFGQQGPYADHATSDLTLAAMAGMVAVNGDADRPPVRISVPQAWLHAAAESAAAALIAHHRREATGEAQFVDVSVQASVFVTALNACIAAAIQGRDIERSGSDVQLGTITLRVMFPCADGDIVMFINGGLLKRVVAWLVEDGVVPESWLTDEDWPTYDVRLLTGQPITHPFPEVVAAWQRYSVRYTKQQHYERGLAAGTFLAPSATIADVLGSEQLAARAYWQPVALADGRSVRGLGPFVRLSHTPIAVAGRVTVPGGDTDAVLVEAAARAGGTEVTA